jgi:hypothetical protein
MQVRADKEFGKCGCGRSPSGQCIGWHGLTEDEWAAQKTQLIHNYNSGHGKVIIEDNPWGDDE